MSDLCVQYGCGLSAPDDWLNYDASPTLRVQQIPILGRLLTRGLTSFPRGVMYGDVVRGLPVQTGTCSAVYCSHVLEHLSLADLRRALRETKRILALGGIFRGVLPDLEILAREYTADTDTKAAITFMDKTMLGVHERPRGTLGAMRAAFGNSQHLWMWDFKALSQELMNVGFTSIRRAKFADSSSDVFTAVEDEGRWHKSLGFECRG
jgi:hypothetical protein